MFLNFQRLKQKAEGFRTREGEGEGEGERSSTKSTPQTPSLDNISDVDSLSVSSEQTSISSMTPDMSNLSLGRGRGQPQKKLVKPTFDDFPIDALEAEQK